MTTHYLDLELMKTICHPTSVSLFDRKDDPIASFENHDVALLESALHVPRATFDAKDLYPTIEDKAAVLFYHLNKNHPFQNGNKRISAVSMIVFLYINDYYLLVSNDELAEKTITVAISDPRKKDEIIQMLQKWIRENINKQDKK